MKEEKELDLAIVGAGAAGLTAGLYASRSKLNTLIFENGLVGGQIRETFSVENFPGFNSISGADLADKMQEQTVNSGADINEFENIEKVKLTDDEKIIETDSSIYKAKSVIIATGSKSRRLTVPEEEKLHGKCIHYCELCDGAMYDGKDLIVVGGGNSAIDAALFLTKYAKNITVVHHSENLKAQKINQDELFKHKNVKLLLNTEILHVLGDNSIENIITENRKTGEPGSLKADGIFVYIGTKPQVDLFKDTLALSESGHIKTNEKLETNIKGVFAAGDVREKEVRQLTTAVNDGSIAALMAEKYIKGF
ncbi:NAD(P)/FAD-dependent oxidoreductase [Clostridium guangxiense]|uniref:NAD(P)/FAD-dependent oxidoreductase n=1 Tax=Clostridium guangxiense TaxID=1662055 RepID=UPI001E2E6623|nr:FAD-dependent oxidoreductase [Clostridium guangxiense]MCD2347910.1 NAD(P)/FAD-dependent oxidoreductase [Clostridium guangxiense]